MKLEQYMTEAISRGRHKAKYRPQLGAEKDDIIEWLNEIGITKGEDWGNSKHGVSIPQVEPGELVYLVGPWYRGTDEETTRWISVFNEREEFVKIVSSWDYPSAYSEKFGTTNKYISFEKAMDLVEMMAKDPGRPINPKDLLESISTGKHRKQYAPEKGCDVDEIVDWLKELGVKTVTKYTGEYRILSRGELVAEVGPSKPGKPSSVWVSLMHGTPKGMQNVAARPNYPSSTFQDVSYMDHNITFEQAIDLMRKIAEHPGEIVTLS